MTLLESIFTRVQDTRNYIEQAKISVNLRKVIDDLDGVLSEMVEARKEPGEPSRKILQISTTADTVTALCEDGTVWCYDQSAKWREYPGIPMPKEGEK